MPSLAFSRRRLLSFWAPAGLLALSGCATARSQYTVSLAQLQQAVEPRFPRSYPLGGMLELQLQAPVLSLHPERARIQAVMPMQAAGALLQQRRYDGVLDVDFALRYEPSDRTLRATDLSVNALRVQGLAEPWAALLEQSGAQLAAQSLREVVLHQLRAQDLATLDGLGLQPGAIRITSKGLVVALEPRPL
jgi:hypothetical protein